MSKIVLVSNTDWYLYRFRLSLARFLRDQGHDVLLVSPSGRFTPQLETEGFRCIPWGVGRKTVNPFAELLSILRLARVIRRERPDVIHLHTVKPVIYGSIAAKMTSNPVTIHTITGRGFIFLGKNSLARILRPLVMLLYKFLLRRPYSRTLFENESDRQFFIEGRLVDAHRTSIVEGVGVDTEHYQPLPEPEGDIVVVMASRMLWDKGVGTLIEAARQANRKSSAKFVLVGEPDPGNPASIEVREIRQWVDEGLVEWWGFKEEMRDVFARAHIIVLPSLGEGIPTVLLEAAACARPIVATDVPGCRDVVEDGVNGFLVPVQDSKALAEALDRLISDQALRIKMGEAGRKLVLERFSSQLINHQTYSIYQGLLAEKGASADDRA